MINQLKTGEGGLARQLHFDRDKRPRRAGQQNLPKPQRIAGPAGEPGQVLDSCQDDDRLYRFLQFQRECHWKFYLEASPKVRLFVFWIAKYCNSWIYQKTGHEHFLRPYVSILHLNDLLDEKVFVDGRFWFKHNTKLGVWDTQWISFRSRIVTTDDEPGVSGSKKAWSEQMSRNVIGVAHFEIERGCAELDLVSLTWLPENNFFSPWHYQRRLWGLKLFQLW